MFGLCPPWGRFFRFFYSVNATLETRIQARTREVEKLLEREHFQRGVVEMVADVNQILITSASKEEMLKAACDRLVARGEYRFAWVGLLTDGMLEVASRSYGAADYMRGVTACLDQRATRECLAVNRAVIETEPDGLGPELVQAGIRALIVLPLRQDAYAKPLGVLGVMTTRPDAFDAEESAMLDQLAGDLGFGIHAFDQRKETRRLQRERISNYEETILSLVDMIEKRDTYTAGHTRRVAHYCELIARKLELPDAEVENLKRAAILHDIGKIAIPDAVLLKPGKLTPLEYELIKQHAEEGYRTLIRIDMYKDLAEIMRYHHERENGTGYPHGLADGQIPRLSQIMAVADAFDAMTTNRIYKPRKEVARALEELRSLAGEQFAADVVEAACEVLRDVQPPSASDQLPKTPLERQRFAYFFDDPLTGAHNGHYLQLMLRNGLPDRLRHAYLIQLRQFTRLNLRLGWAGGNQVLAEFAAHLTRHYPEAVLFRVMGDDFVLITPRPLDLDAAGLVDRTALAGTEVTVEVREIDPRGPEREGLLDLL
ncbi:MAG: HD domain-containing phosphohydrolase [Pseudomonadota bacterium]